MQAVLRVLVDHVLYPIFWALQLLFYLAASPCIMLAVLRDSARARARPVPGPGPGPTARSSADWAAWVAGMTTVPAQPRVRRLTAAELDALGPARAYTPPPPVPLVTVPPPAAVTDDPWPDLERGLSDATIVADSPPPPPAPAPVPSPRPLTDEADEGPTCAVCQDALAAAPPHKDNGSTAALVRVLPCAHAFHDACIRAWVLGYEGTCPLCKRDLAQEAGRSG